MKENIVSNLWKECKKVFLASNNEQLTEMLKEILKVVKRNYNIFKANADLEFLDYVTKMDVDEYIVGTCGDDFELRLKVYMQQEDVPVERIWEILSQLIWDLTVPVTDRICPFCHCDNLVLLVDKENRHMYESCENCFWISEDGIQIRRPDVLFPANVDMLKSHNCTSFIRNKLITSFKSNGKTFRKYEKTSYS